MDYQELDLVLRNLLLDNLNNLPALADLNEMLLQRANQIETLIAIKSKNYASGYDQ